MSSSHKIFGDENEDGNGNEPPAIKGDTNNQNEYQGQPSLSTGVYGSFVLRNSTEINQRENADEYKAQPSSSTEEKEIEKEYEAPAFKVFKWGKIVIEHNGNSHKFKDCIIKPSGAMKWNWKLDGTRHKPGITVAAVENNKLLDGADVVILTKGMNNVLQTKQETIEYVENAKKDGKIDEYYRLQSEKAVEKYKELVANGKKVSGLFHSTC